MVDTAGTVIAIATGGSIEVCIRQSHIPFPNTPLVRGIGTKRPEAAQGRG